MVVETLQSGVRGEHRNSAKNKTTHTPLPQSSSTFGKRHVARNFARFDKIPMEQALPKVREAHDGILSKTARRSTGEDAHKL